MTLNSMNDMCPSVFASNHEINIPLAPVLQVYFF